jgi:membrane-bound lytic murein transglycosylase D
MRKNFWVLLLLAGKLLFGMGSVPDSTSIDTLVYSRPALTNDSIKEDTALILNEFILGNVDSLMQSFYYSQRPADDKEEFDSLAYLAFVETPDSIIQMRIDSINLFTPFELVYNRQVKQYLNTYLRKDPKLLRKIVGLSRYYFPMFEEYLDKYNLPFELKYLAVIESALNPTANSRAGAKGLWQFMYRTGRMYGLRANSIVDDRFDPDKETDAACRHLKDLYDIYHNWSLALAAYNSGAGNVNKALRRAGGIKNYWAIWPFLPRETRGYVPAFTAVVYVLSFAEEAGIHTPETSVPFYETDTVTIGEVLSFEQVHELLKIPMDTLKFLNPTFKRGIIPATKTKKYTLRLPREFVGAFIDKEKELYAFKTKSGIEKEKLAAQIKKIKERQIHIVRSGENLGLIAQKYHTSVRKIKAWNGLRSSRIYPGKRLIVYGGDYTYNSRPKKTKKSSQKTNAKKGKYRYHTVRKGDTLWDIANLYKGVSVKDIKRLNHISNSHRLKPGQKIKIYKKS